MLEFEKIDKKAYGIRRDIVEMLCEAKSGHPGGSLSATDILLVLYNLVMDVDPKNPRKEDRDRFVLSKGHAAPALYAVLADRGFFPREWLKTLRKFGSKLQGHPDMNSTPGIDMSTGSLGQGLSVANGMALSAKIYNKPYYTYVIMGDGEIQEGQVWEAAMTSAHYKLDNVIAFVDYNNLQIDGHTSDIMEVRPVDAKFEAFGWEVESVDGHNVKEIYDAIIKLKSNKNGKPKLILANTIKGKGVSFMENVCDFHGVAPTAEETEKAIDELSNVEEIITKEDMEEVNYVEETILKSGGCR